MINTDEEEERMKSKLNNFKTLSSAQWSTLQTGLKKRKEQKEKSRLMKERASSKNVKRSAKQIKEASQLPSTRRLGASSKIKGGSVGRMGIGSKKITLRSDETVPSEEASHSGSAA